MFNVKSLTMLSLAIAMLLCTTTQTTRAVLIDFEDIPVGTTYEIGDTFIASGVTIEIRGITGSGGGARPAPFSADNNGEPVSSHGVIVERPFWIPDGQLPDHELQLTEAEATILLERAATMITMEYLQTANLLINSWLILPRPTNEPFVSVFDGITVRSTFTEGEGYFTEITGHINTFSFVSSSGNQGYFDNIDITYIPEPATLLIMGTGLLFGVRRR